jgi:hypothetical protein
VIVNAPESAVFTACSATERSSAVGKYVARSLSFILKVVLEAEVMRTLATEVFLLPTASMYLSDFVAAICFIKNSKFKI